MKSYYQICIYIFLSFFCSIGIYACGQIKRNRESSLPALKKIFKPEEISIGPYVLTGGELAAAVLVDAISRQLPGVLGKAESLEEKRLGVGVPVYTRPEIFVYKGKKYRVPKVLVSGNHAEIEKWRRDHRKSL